MNKSAVLKKIIAHLGDGLDIYKKAAGAARAEATHEQSKAENKYDTRGLEASYLARGQARQAAEIMESIEEFQMLDPKPWPDGKPIGLGALVELQEGKELSLYFIGPRAGGTEVVHQKREILVITLQSPLGQQLSEKKEGDILQLNLGGRKSRQTVLAVY